MNLCMYIIKSVIKPISLSRPYPISPTQNRILQETQYPLPSPFPSSRPPNPPLSSILPTIPLTPHRRLPPYRTKLPTIPPTPHRRLNPHPPRQSHHTWRWPPYFPLRHSYTIPITQFEYFGHGWWGRGCGWGVGPGYASVGAVLILGLGMDLGLVVGVVVVVVS